MRVFNVAFQPLGWDWQPIVWALAALSMIAGSVLAIAQTDIKRMLAYSSISQAGFVLIGLTATGETGISAALFYLVAYAATMLGAFGVVMLVSSRGERSTSLAAYAGLGRRSPAAGRAALPVPAVARGDPADGRVRREGARLPRGDRRRALWPLALIGVLVSVVAAFVYLRVIVLMFMREPEERHEPDESLLPRLALAVPAAVVLVLGVFPGLVAGFLEDASVLRW